jgi:ABC-2 type transport system ATP-binding protein
MMTIEATGLTKSFGAVTALGALDLSVDRGRVCALLGPNGAGKTTAVRILATLTRPDAGHATVAGHDIARQPRLVRASIGLVGQHAAVDDDLTGQENLVILGLMYHLGLRAARQRDPRRADDRAGSPQPGRDLGRGARPGPLRDHRPAQHAVPG